MIRNKQKILVVALKNYYINITDDAIYAALGKFFDLVFFGPGYQKEKILKKGLVEFYKKNGPFELAIMHQYVHQNIFRCAKRCVEGATAQKFYFNQKYFSENFPRFGYDFFELSCPKVLMALRTDTHAFTEEKVKLYSDFPGFFIVTPPQLMTPLKEKLDQQAEFKEISINDNFLEFGRRCQQRIIPVPHTVFDNEIITYPLKNRKLKVSVPGAPYQDRLLAINILRSAGYKVLDQTLIQKILMKSNAIMNNKLSSNIFYIKKSQSEFKKILKSSQIVFTDGSRSRSPIRKFFEIPASGAVLVGDMFRDCQALGFVQNKHYIYSTANNLSDLMKSSTWNDVTYLQTMANSSVKMIRETHSVTARAKQLKSVFNSILQNQYQGSLWANGGLVLMTVKDKLCVD
jgi:hypothetical protein